MAEINNKPPPAPLPQTVPLLGNAAQRTIDFNRNKQRNLKNQRDANRLHEPAVRTNRSSPDNRRGVELREKDRSDAFVQGDNLAETEELGGDDSGSTTRQSAQRSIRQDRSEFTSGPPTLNAYVAPQTNNPAAQTRSATAARYTSPEHRRGTSSTGASSRSGFDGAAEQLVSMNGEQLPRAFVEMVRSRQAPSQQTAPSSEAPATEGHEVSREEHTQAQVQTSLTSARTAAQAASAPFSQSCVAAATRAAQLGMGPTLRHHRLRGEHQRSIFGKGAAPEGDANATADGPVDRVVNFQTGQVVYKAPPEDGKVDWL